MAEVVSDEEVVDSYLYLLARLLVLRQENLDINVEQVGYNTIKYNPVAGATFVNPNIDVAYLESWIAVDADHAVVLNIPEISGRYYTAQILDGWGEVIDNLNERTHPDHPSGQFAFAIAGTDPPIPAGRCALTCPLGKQSCWRESNSATTPKWPSRSNMRSRSMSPKESTLIHRWRSPSSPTPH